MLHAIWRVLTDAVTEHADDEVLKHLALAWVAASEVDGASEVVDSDEAHAIFVGAYYGGKDEENPREVSVPEWAPRSAPLLRRLARAERKRDDHALSMLRALAQRRDAHAGGFAYDAASEE